MENNKDGNLITNISNAETVEQKETMASQQSTISVQQQNIDSIAIAQTLQPAQNITPNESSQEKTITLDSNQTTAELMGQQTLLQKMNQSSPTTQTNFEKEVCLNNIQPTNYKNIAIFLIVILVIVLLSFPIYESLNNYLNEKQVKVPEPVIKQPTPETPSTPEQKPVEPTLPPINFDMDLSFDKGYSKKPNEYHQTISYTPESNEGVVKCETIKTVNTTEAQSNTVAYFYYKDKMTKKLLLIDIIKYKNKQTYNTYVNEYQNFRATLSKNKHLFTKLEVDNSTYRTNFYMLVDLAYSQTTAIPNSNQYYHIKISYNTPIKKAMEKFITDPLVSGNMYCSTIVTADASI